MGEYKNGSFDTFLYRECNIRGTCGTYEHCGGTRWKLHRYNVVGGTPTESPTDTGYLYLEPLVGPLFTSGADIVDFNVLTVAAGADLYDGLGGSDVVTLPDVANYNESVGNGQTLDWDPSQTFTTGSLAGDTYTVNGGDGSYKIALGAGTDNVLTGSAPSPSPGGSLDTTGNSSGSVTIGSNSTFELSAGATFTGAINFGSPGGTLKIDQPSSFVSSINGLQIGDVIDLADSIISEAIDGSTLILTDTNGQTLNYQIAGNIAGNGFLISNDGSGDSDLTLKAVPNLDSQSSKLAGQIIDAVQAARTAFLKGIALALDTGSAEDLLLASDTLANACVAVGVGINFTVASATLLSDLQIAKSPVARYAAVENFDVAVTNTLAKTVFVYLAAASPAIIVGFLEGLLDTTI